MKKILNTKILARFARNTKYLVATLPILILLTAYCLAAVPQKINYEGRLTDASGNALTGSYNLRFTITSDSGGSTAVWGPETHSGVTVTSGVFSVSLGETTAITSSVFSGDTRYLKVEVANPPTSSNYETLAPATQIVSIAYALRAAQADNAGGGSVSYVGGGAGLSGGPITGVGTLEINTNVVVTTSDAQTLTNKTWNGNKISEIYGGTNQTTYSTGEMLYASAANTLSKLSIGLPGEVLKVSSGLPAWGSVAGTGTVTYVGSGPGLTGGPITSAGTLEIANGGITASMIASGTVTSGAISNNTIINEDLAAGTFSNITGVGTLNGLTVSGSTELSDRTVYTPSGINSISAASGITAVMLNKNLIRIAGNGGPVVVTASPPIAAGQDGQVIILRGTDNTNTVEFLPGNTALALSSNTSFTLGRGDNLMLFYDATAGSWYEINRNDN